MFFEKLERQCCNLRIFKGELPHTDYNVATASAAYESGINRVTHERLHSAEKFSTIAAELTGMPYPSEDIRKAYNDMMLFDEHCFGMSLPFGKVQDWNWSSKSHYAHKASAVSDSILHRSLKHISSKILREENCTFITVFNSLSFSRTDIVRVSDFEYEGGTFKLVDMDTGEDVPYQISRIDNPMLPKPYASHRYAMGRVYAEYSREMVFAAENVPPMGYKSYKIKLAHVPREFVSNMKADETGMESAFFILKLDTDTGNIGSIYDKELAKDLIDKDATHKLNQLVVRQADTGELKSPGDMRVVRVEAGPVYSSMLMYGSCPGCPELVQEITIYDKIKRIDISNRVLKDMTPFQEVYFAFPFNIDKPSFRYEGTNSIIEPFKNQFPGSNTNYYSVQHWAEVSGGETRIIISPVEANILEFGGLWTCYVSQAHHGVEPMGFGKGFADPSEINKGYMYSFVMDSNFRTNFAPVQLCDTLFRYSITSAGMDRKEAEETRFGWGSLNPLIPSVAKGKSGGQLKSSASICKVSADNLNIVNMKMAEDGRGMILRLIETAGRDGAAVVEFPGSFISRALLTNAVEEDGQILTCKGHTIEVHAKAFQLVTLRIETGPIDDSRYGFFFFEKEKKAYY